MFAGAFIAQFYCHKLRSHPHLLNEMSSDWGNSIYQYSWLYQLIDFVNNLGKKEQIVCLFAN